MAKLSTTQIVGSLSVDGQTSVANINVEGSVLFTNTFINTLQEDGEPQKPLEITGDMLVKMLQDINGLKEENAMLKTRLLNMEKRMR